ncbi:MAG: hypothetical protein ACJAYU_004450, partial [Bradymonadia bacterium]
MPFVSSDERPLEPQALSAGDWGSAEPYESCENDS